MDPRKRKARKFHCLLKQHPSHHQIHQRTFNHFYSLLSRQNPSRKWKIETDLYCKPTKKHQYLLHSSSHPYHTKKQSPTALLSVYDVLVQKMTSSIPARSTELERYLTKPGYKNNFVRSQISRAKSIPRNATLKENSPEIKQPDRGPFITSFNLALPNIYKVLRQKQPILHSTERLHEIFKETPVLAYRRSPNLRDLLVCAKLQNQQSPLNPTILLALSAAALNMDVSLAHTLIMKEQTTHLTTLGKCEKSNSK